jgi:large subunit ribosomal protein L20
MPRVKSQVARLKRKKKIMRAAKGARGGRSKLYKTAKENVERGMRYAYRDRRRKKRDFRRLWIVRINAGARLHELSYSGLWRVSSGPVWRSIGNSSPIWLCETL